jgi:hypothetical protein
MVEVKQPLGFVHPEHGAMRFSPETMQLYFVEILGNPFCEV